MDFLLNVTKQNEYFRERLRCPLCSSTTLTPFLRRNGVPVLTNLLMETQEAARQIQRGKILLVVCENCGFVFNCAFEHSVLYTMQYDNSQAYAPAFEHYLDELVHALVSEQQIHQCRILEVGCGDGLFLRKLVEAGSGNTGYGFDPSYRGPASLLDGRLQFAPCYYDETCSHIRADVLICRHVIEHIPQPLPFLRLLHRALDHASPTRAFFETPSLEWILRNSVLWDIYMETDATDAFTGWTGGYLRSCWQRSHTGEFDRS
jgi:2-polyprenyl-3-methyl-5-hydroxy-6-metoxy-1,4-benzoquinol methylase